MSDQTTQPTDDEEIINENPENELGDIVDDFVATEYNEDETPTPTGDEEIINENPENELGDIVDDFVATEYNEDETPIPTEEPTSDQMDIDAALAAVSQLTLLANDDNEEDVIVDADYQPVGEEIDDAVIDENPSSIATFEFDMPKDLSMSRGQLASVIPAIALIAVGGWLTLTLTTADTSPTIGILFPIALIIIGLMFLAQWLTSGRWSRGSFFIGASTALIGGIQFYISQISPDLVNSSWTFWIIAIGIALFGAGILTVPRLPRLGIMGILVMLAGGIAYLLTSGIIDANILNFVSNLWFIGVAIAFFMLIAPLIRRRQ